MNNRDNEERRRGSEGSKKRGSYERDGVYYTPSGTKPSKSAGAAARGKGTGAAKRTVRDLGSASEKPKRKASKGQYVTFYIVTLVAAVVVCLTTFFFVYSHTAGNRPAANGSDNSLITNAVTAPEQTPVSAIDEISISGLIMNLSHSARTLEVLDLESQRILSFRSDNSTAMHNRYGEIMSFAQFRPGDIVDARYTEVGGVLSSMSLATAAWERRNVTNVRVNPENRSLSIGNDVFRYDERTISIFNDNPFNIEEIDPLSVVTLRGMGSNVWFVEVSRGTGIINIINGESIRDGVIEIDNNLTLQLNERGQADEPIRVQSGNRRILIRGSNIEDFSTNLDVNSGESAILDLSNVQIVAGVVTLNISELDAVVTVNGTPRRSGEPLILSYGSYELVVRKEGFVTYESTFELNEPTLDLVIVLEAEIRTRNITIESTPQGANVYIDNNFVGITPITTSIEEGIRMITLRRDGFVEITLPTDEGNRYHFTLRELQVDPFAGGGSQFPPSNEPPVMP